MYMNHVLEFVVPLQLCKSGQTWMQTTTWLMEAYNCIAVILDFDLSVVSLHLLGYFYDLRGDYHLFEMRISLLGVKPTAFQKQNYKLFFAREIWGNMFSSMCFSVFTQLLLSHFVCSLQPSAPPCTFCPCETVPLSPLERNLCLLALVFDCRLALSLSVTVPNRYKHFFPFDVVGQVFAQTSLFQTHFCFKLLS